MSETKKTVKLSKIKQLIDLNGDSINFDLSFKVTCHDDTPFKVLVVDQTTLDNTPNLQYKETKNTISGNIVADKNIYQNYFLILKADKECKVDVELTKKLLPKTPDVEMGGIPFIGQNENVENERLSQKVSTCESSSLPWKKIGFITLVVVIGICVLWWLYKRKGDSNKPENVEKTVVGYQQPSHVHSSDQGSEHGSSRSYHNGSKGVHTSGKVNASPALSSYDNRAFKPPTRVSPDIMSQTSRQSSGIGGDDGNSLLHRLRKFAR
jgi:hypothetical protein